MRAAATDVGAPVWVGEARQRRRRAGRKPHRQKIIADPAPAGGSRSQRRGQRRFATSRLAGQRHRRALRARRAGMKTPDPTRRQGQHQTGAKRGRGNGGRHGRRRGAVEIDRGPIVAYREPAGALDPQPVAGGPEPALHPQQPPTHPARPAVDQSAVRNRRRRAPGERPRRRRQRKRLQLGQRYVADEAQARQLVAARRGRAAREREPKVDALPPSRLRLRLLRHADAAVGDSRARPQGQAPDVSQPVEPGPVVAQPPPLGPRTGMLWPAAAGVRAQAVLRSSSRPAARWRRCQSSAESRCHTANSSAGVRARLLASFNHCAPIIRSAPGVSPPSRRSTVAASRSSPRR